MKNTFYFSVLLIIAALISCSKDDFNGKACFTYSPESNIKAGNEVTFSNCSNDAAYSLWSFGDDSTSIENAPTHSYTNAGTYTVTLAVQDEKFIDLNADMQIDEKDRYTGESDIITATITVTE